MSFGRLSGFLAAVAVASCTSGEPGYKGPTNFSGGTQADTLRSFDSSKIDLDRLSDLGERFDNGTIDRTNFEREFAEITGITSKGIRDFLVRGIEEELNILGHTLNSDKAGRFELLSAQDRCTIDGAVDKTMFYLPDIIGQAVANTSGGNVVILNEDSLIDAFEETRTTCARNYGEIGVTSLNAQEIGDIALNKAVLSLAAVLTTESVKETILTPRSQELISRQP